MLYKYTYRIYTFCVSSHPIKMCIYKSFINLIKRNALSQFKILYGYGETTTITPTFSFQQHKPNERKVNFHDSFNKTVHEVNTLSIYLITQREFLMQMLNNIQKNIKNAHKRENYICQKFLPESYSGNSLKLNLQCLFTYFVMFENV